VEICLISLVLYLSDDYHFINDSFAIIVGFAGSDKNFNYEFNFSAADGLFLHSFYQQKIFCLVEKVNN
jgi:hypothetical protein